MVSPSLHVPSGLHHVTVPAEYARHVLLQGGPFYTLPESLLNALSSEVGQERFDADLWAMERALTRACGGDDVVGFWNGQRISCPLLRFQPLEVDPALVRSLGWTDAQIDALNTVGSERDSWSAMIARGYAGWLLTNPTFLAEHSDLLNTWQSEIAEFQIPLMGFVVPDARVIRKAMNRTAQVTKRPGRRMKQFVEAFEAFFVRWRLAALTSPYLPAPLRPQIPVAILESVLGHMRGGGQTFYVPDTFPIPSRDELRDMLEEALRGADSPEHLADWTAIVRNENSAKSAIKRYARLFELQHYIRALYQRHAGALKRHKALVNIAFGSFLKASAKSIEEDLQSLARTLGKEWYLTLPNGPRRNP